jgi:hypothetical protein
LLAVALNRAVRPLEMEGGREGERRREVEGCYTRKDRFPGLVAPNFQGATENSSDLARMGMLFDSKTEVSERGPPGYGCP